MSDSLWPRGLQPGSLLCPWDFPGKNNGMSFPFLVQGTFPIQRSNSCLPLGRSILYYWITWNIYHLLYIYCYLLKLVFSITKFKLKFTWYIGIQKCVAILLRQHITVFYTIPLYKCLYNSFGGKIIILCISDSCFIQRVLLYPNFNWFGST